MVKVYVLLESATIAMTAYDGMESILPPETSPSRFGTFMANGKGKKD